VVSLLLLAMMMIHLPALADFCGFQMLRRRSLGRLFFAFDFTSRTDFMPFIPR
jgi:hypothetical protein